MTQTKPTVHSDRRGILVELVKEKKIGQFYYSTTKPGSVRGNHYHTRKLEMFFVIKGKGQMVLKNMKNGKIHKVILTGKNITGIKVTPYHVHAVKNVGKEEMIMLIYCNEVFNPKDSDTFHHEIIKP
ncbi:MAG: hypothetical protein EPN86_02690 [Nanoarchaeota archaeon]|nr:MAG: hypothetical protein EPN86_02690 [Nanoarchaeota archaeon]